MVAWLAIEVQFLKTFFYELQKNFTNNLEPIFLMFKTDFLSECPFQTLGHSYVFVIFNYTSLYVTGSGKRDIFAQTMIFLYKRCCLKKRNIIY